MLVADTLNVVIAKTVVQQGRALNRFSHDDLGAVFFLEVITGSQRTSGAGSSNVGSKLGVLLTFGYVEIQFFHRSAGTGAVNNVVTKFAELVEDDVVRLTVKEFALVVNFLNVAFAARRTDNVVRRRNPLVEPVETLLTHVLRQHGNTVATEDARDGHATTAVVAGRRPHSAVVDRVELAGNDTRHQASVSSQHLVCVDHRELVTQRQNDARLDARQFARQLDMLRHIGHAGAICVIEPVNAEQVQRMRGIRIDILQLRTDAGRNRRRVFELTVGRQKHTSFAETRNGILINGLIDYGGFKTKTCHLTAPSN